MKLMVHLQVVKLGYKSVAHYLIQTYQNKTKAENSGAVVPVERSNTLEEPFPQDEVPCTGEEPEDLTHGDSEEEIEKMLLDNKHVDAKYGADKDGVLKEKKDDKGDRDVKIVE